MTSQRTQEQCILEFSERAANYVAEMFQAECRSVLSPAETKRLDEAIWEVLTSATLDDRRM